MKLNKSQTQFTNECTNSIRHDAVGLNALRAELQVYGKLASKKDEELKDAIADLFDAVRRIEGILL